MEAAEPRVAWFRLIEINAQMAQYSSFTTNL